MSYGSLHCHDELSNVTTGLDSINKLKSMVEYAEEIGLTGLAITNHDNLSSIWQINQMQKQLRKKESPLKLIYGNEIYLLRDWDPQDSSPRKYPHFILLAKDRIGYEALLKLSTKAWYRSAHVRGKRRVVTLYSDLEEIITDEVRGHIIGATACLGGEAASLFLDGKEEEGHKFLEWCLGVFGQEDFYVELQSSSIPDQTKWNKIIQTIPNIKTIITTDAHYTRKSEFEMLEAFLRSSNESREVREYYDAAYLQTEEEIYEYLNYLPTDLIEESLKNTNRIVEQVEFFDIAQKFHIPVVPMPELAWTGPPTTGYPVISKLLQSGDTQTMYTVVTCLEKLLGTNKWNDTYLSRLEEEFDVFQWQSEELEDNFFAYFNNMAYHIRMSWEVGCAVGPSRGSASGSLLCYLMEIVQCDPIEYGLPFWRFANKHRASVLDIDCDFDPVKKPDLLAKIREERGELGVTQVATFKTLTLKAAIGNACRGYRSSEFKNGIDADISTYLNGLVQVVRGKVANLDQTLNGDEIRGFKKNTQLANELAKYPGLIDMIIAFEGLITNSSTHAAAVVFFDLENDPITNHCSLMRSPNGDLCTAMDLHSVEEVGCIKYDYLVLGTLSIMTATFDLLRKDNVIDPNLTLKECYRTYIDPNKIDYDNPEIWRHLEENDILSIFQWDQASGRRGIAATKPAHLNDLTVVNGLIRLMSQDGEENQLDRFARIKENPQSFEDEMVKVGLSAEQRQIMHEELDKYNGCAATQESFMILVQRLAGYSLKEADQVRKVVAKKKIEEVEQLRATFYERCSGTQKQKEYLYNVIIRPSEGYGFSLNHALPYSIIGVQCIMLGGILFPPGYWQTACLLQRSGTLDGKSTNYDKIARAVADLQEQGIKIKPPNINISQREFTLKADTQTIYFGTDAIKGLKTFVAEKIYNLRPFEDVHDFWDRAHPDVGSLTALVRAGAFDEMADRQDTIDFLAEICLDSASSGGTLRKLNGQNLLRVSREGLWPTDTEELELARRVFNFTHYLKQFELEDGDWALDERGMDFLDSIDYPHDGTLNKGEWKEAYDVYMIPIKKYLVDHQEELLKAVNRRAIDVWKEKYFTSTAQDEIEALGICFEEHPFAQIVKNVTPLNEIPEEPQIARTFPTKDGRIIAMYELYMICGIAIAKDKQHHTMTLLTPQGPIDVKFTKEGYAHYDSQVSRIVNGKKEVLESSWFNRGNGLLIHGMKRDGMFVAKKYKNSPMKHTVYKILSVDNGKPELQQERRVGKMEESSNEENN